MARRRKGVKGSSGDAMDLAGYRRKKFLELLDAGYGIEEAMKELGVGVFELAKWLEDEEFQVAMDEWRRGVAIVVEGKLVDAAKRGRSVAAVKYLQSVEPNRWSERLRLEGRLEEDRVVKVVFGWVPKDERSMRGDVYYSGGVLEGVERPSLGSGGGERSNEGIIDALYAEIGGNETRNNFEWGELGDGEIRQG